MVFDKPGYVTENILMLGRKESCVYLLKGEDCYALLGGGMAHIVPEILEQLTFYEIDESRIRQIVIFHSHFDHCGIVPFFKKRWPRAEIVASERAKVLLSTPRVIESIEKLNQILFARYGRQEEAAALNLSFSGIAVDTVVKDGDRLTCGGVTLEILEVPGHSTCCIAVYVPETKSLFASDAGGIPYGDRVFTAANSNFDKYHESLRRMAAYDIVCILAEHFGARCGEDAKLFIERSMASVTQTRLMMENSLAGTRDEKKSVEEVTDALMADVSDEFLPREVITLVVGQMIRYIAKQAPAVRFGGNGDAVRR